MKKDELNTDKGRRQFVKLAAGTAVVLPLSGLVACSGGDDKPVAKKAEEAANATAEAAKKATDAAVDATESEMDSTAELAADAKDAAGEMATDAKDAATEMAGDAKDAATGMVDDAKDAASSMADNAAGAAQEAAGGLPRVKEDDAVAQALGYRHDASKLDQSKYAGRGTPANEQCKNCALYIAGKDGWGACSIFAGKAVNANGWCASYNRKSA